MNKIVKRFKTFFSISYFFLLDNMRELRALSPEKVPVYIDISTRIDGSPSREIVRMREVLIAIILESDDPRRAFDAIEDIFIQNNLPTAAKVIKVFDVLNTPKRLEQVLADKTASPVLKNAPFDLARRAIIRRDIFNVAVRSGNRNLRAYLELLDQSSELATAFMNGKQLTPTERARLEHLVRKLITLYKFISYGHDLETPVAIYNLTTDAGLGEALSDLYANYLVGSGSGLRDGRYADRSGGYVEEFERRERHWSGHGSRAGYHILWRSHGQLDRAPTCRQADDP